MPALQVAAARCTCQYEDVAIFVNQHDSLLARKRATVSSPHPERGDKGGLRDVDLAELERPLFAFLLLLGELALLGYVAAIAFGSHVPPERLDRLPGDDRQRKAPLQGAARFGLRADAST